MSPGSSTSFSVTQSPPESLRSVIQSLSCIFISRAFFQSLFRFQIWFVLEVGPTFDRGLDSVHPSERPQPQLRSRLQHHHRSPRQYLRSLRGFIDIRHGWDPEPHRLCLRGELGGPGPPSVPAHQTQASHLPLGLNHHQLHRLPRQHHRLSCRLPPRSGGRCS